MTSISIFSALRTSSQIGGFSFHISESKMECFLLPHHLLPNKGTLPHEKPWIHSPPLLSHFSLIKAAIKHSQLFLKMPQTCTFPFLNYSSPKLTFLPKIFHWVSIIHKIFQLSEDKLLPVKVFTISSLSNSHFLQGPCSPVIFIRYLLALLWMFTLLHMSFCGPSRSSIPEFPKPS